MSRFRKYLLKRFVEVIDRFKSNIKLIEFEAKGGLTILKIVAKNVFRRMDFTIDV
jgi:glutathione peroxidase-family protein